jgi:hypothetical protein
MRTLVDNAQCSVCHFYFFRQSMLLPSQSIEAELLDRGRCMCHECNSLLCKMCHKAGAIAHSAPRRREAVLATRRSLGA